MDDEFIVIDCPCKTVDGGVVQRWINLGDHVPLALITFDGEAIGTIDTQVNDGIDGKRSLVAGQTRAQEVLH